MSKAVDKITSILEKVDTTDELVTILDVVRQYTLSRLKQKEQELISQQTELQNKIEKLNNN